MSWFFLFVHVLFALALVGVGAALVRPVNARAGILLAAAGGVRALFLCCNRGLVIAVDPGSKILDFWGYGVGTLAHIVIVGLVIAALILLARDLESRKKTGGIDRPPTSF